METLFREFSEHTSNLCASGWLALATLGKANAPTHLDYASTSCRNLKKPGNLIRTPLDFSFSLALRSQHRFFHL